MLMGDDGQVENNSFGKLIADEEECNRDAGIDVVITVPSRAEGIQ